MQPTLVRESQIFASVVREILEVKLLREITPHPLTLTQFHLLKMFALNGTAQVGRVAAFLGMSVPAASKNIGKLERLGYLQRTPSPVDRRASLLRANQRGRDLVEAYEAEKRERLAPVLDEFGEEEVEQFSSLMERFSLAVIRREAAQGGFCFRCAAYCRDDCPVGKIRGGCPYQEFRDSSRGTP